MDGVSIEDRVTKPIIPVQVKMHMKDHQAMCFTPSTISMYSPLLLVLTPIKATELPRCLQYLNVMET